FVSMLINNQNLSQVQSKIKFAREEWSYLGAQQRINLLNELHESCFKYCFPRPDCKTTFSRVRFTATFHSNDWSMRFSENFFQSHPFDQSFKTWIHESFHAFLHFSSLRINLEVASDVLSPPKNIIDLARRSTLRDDGSTLAKLAKKNLLGMIDRQIGNTNSYSQRRSVRIGNEIFTPKSQAPSMAGMGLDSYYLNVEITTENLTEALFKRLLPGFPFRRSYATPEEYIQRRLSGQAPVFAAK
ncbi:MAG TPA: hypothetical protein V6C96_03310, partial [Vampirovibrionales bacterium]